MKLKKNCSHLPNAERISVLLEMVSAMAVKSGRKLTSADNVILASTSVV